MNELKNIKIDSSKAGKRIIIIIFNYCKSRLFDVNWAVFRTKLESWDSTVVRRPTEERLSQSSVL